MTVEVRYQSGDGWWIRAAGREAHAVHWSKTSEAHRRFEIFRAAVGNNLFDAPSVWTELDTGGNPTGNQAQLAPVQVKHYAGAGWWIRCDGREAPASEWAGSEAHRRYVLYRNHQRGIAPSLWETIDENGWPT